MEDFNEVMDEIEVRVKEDDIRCIIIDNISSMCEHFINSDNGATTTDFIERSRFLLKTATILKRMTYKYNIVVITINNVVADMSMRSEEDDPTKMYTEKFRTSRASGIKPSLGPSWTSYINDRI